VSREHCVSTCYHVSFTLSTTLLLRAYYFLLILPITVLGCLPLLQPQLNVTSFTCIISITHRIVSSFQSLAPSIRIVTTSALKRVTIIHLHPLYRYLHIYKTIVTCTYFTYSRQPITDNNKAAPTYDFSDCL